jgi:hypothetical protein
MADLPSGQRRGQALEEELSSMTAPLYLYSSFFKPTDVSFYVHLAHRLLIGIDITYQGKRERVGSFYLPVSLSNGPLKSTSPANI